MTERVNNTLVHHLVRADGQEDLCFALSRPSRGRTRLTALVYDVILPREGEREVHGNVSFQPAYIERVLQMALESECGVAFLHSHPASGWQGMSGLDVRAEKGLAPTVLGVTRLPLLGMTLAAEDQVWSARVWPRIAPREFERVWCTSVRVVGVNLKVHFCDALLPIPEHRESQARTRAAWGPEAHADLVRLKVGVAGLGSVGSIVAEAIARTGLQRAHLFEYQSIEEINLDRTRHAAPADAARSVAKVEVTARAMRDSATSSGFLVEPGEWSICEEEGYRRAL